MPTNSTVMTTQNGVQQHYEQLMASIDGILWEVDAQTFHFTYVSEQAERLLGYALAEWTKPNFWIDHLHPEDCAWATAFCRQATNENRNHSFEYRMIAADGRTVWLRDMVSVVVENAAVSKVCGIMIDITERKLAEEERQAHLWFLESMDKVNRAIQSAAEDVRAQASGQNTDALLTRYPGAKIGDFDGQPDRITEMDALIAYLQVLGTMVNFSDVRLDEPKE